MPSSTVEDYLKQIFLLQQGQAPRERAAMGRIAESVGVAPGTATTMIKGLTESGLVDYQPRSGVRLTAKGQRQAVDVLRRHRLIELFLVEVLGLDWSEVHDEAERLEHAVSDKVLKLIDSHLGHPETDPHGDPIPTAAGAVSATPRGSLADCAIGEDYRIARVLEQNPKFLRFLERTGLTPGQSAALVGRDEDADAVTIRPDGHKEVTIGTAAASKILVEPAGRTSR